MFLTLSDRTSVLCPHNPACHQADGGGRMLRLAVFMLVDKRQTGTDNQRIVCQNCSRTQTVQPT